MKIVQITDLHIAQEGVDTYGADVRGNFLAALNAATAWAPDFLVLTGDLCFQDGDAGIYAWIRAQTEEWGIPYEVIPGNHDHSAMMAEAFSKQSDLKDGELYYARTWNNRQVLFLDTAPGRMSDNQWDWLRERLDEQPGDTLIFMHHPPLRAGVPFMDQYYPFQQPTVFQNITDHFPGNITVFTGHYHVEKTIRQGNLLVYITPSTFFQIDQRSESLQIDHRRPGIRIIEVDEAGVKCTVQYL